MDKEYSIKYGSSSLNITSPGRVSITTSGDLMGGFYVDGVSWPKISNSDITNPAVLTGASNTLVWTKPATLNGSSNPIIAKFYAPTTKGITGQMVTMGSDGVPTWEEFRTMLLSFAYPVGAIYMSTVNLSPAVTMGGTWESIQDVFLLAAGTRAVGTTGGSETHTLSISEMPAHNHKGTTTKATTMGYLTGSGATQLNSTGTITYKVDYTTTDNSSEHGLYASGAKPQKLTTVTTSEFGVYTEGSGQPFQILPPYLAVYVWKRTA